MSIVLRFPSDIPMVTYIIWCIALRCHRTDRHRWRTPHQSSPTDVDPCQGSTSPCYLAWYGGLWRHPAPPSVSRHLEPSIVPPRLIIYSNRVGLEPNLPPTRLLTHTPPDCLCSVSVLYATSLIPYNT